jgi:hypothetical protein
MELDKPQEVLLRGEVIQIFQEGGQRIAKIAVGPRNYVDVAADNIPDAHLGDAVVIEACFTIYKVELDSESQGLNATDSGFPETETDRTADSRRKR